MFCVLFHGSVQLGVIFCFYLAFPVDKILCQQMKIGFVLKLLLNDSITLGQIQVSHTEMTVIKLTFLYDVSELQCDC